MSRMRKQTGIAASGAMPAPPIQKRRMNLTAYLFVLPAFAIYAVFLLWPTVRLVVLSFQDWNGLNATRTWIGLNNYLELLNSSEFWGALSHNLLWVLMAAFPILIGLGLAMILHSLRPSGSGIYRVIYFLPYTLTVVLVGIVWKWIYDPVWGPLSAFFRAVGLKSLSHGWLGDASSALPALALAANWTGYGFCMMLFLAGLGHIDPLLYDSAAIDGANTWQKFRHVTLPGLANTLNVVILIVFIATVRVFDIVYVTTRGGPVSSTEVLGTLIHRETFESQDVGYGAALSVMTALIILLASLAYLRFREREA